MHSATDISELAVSMVIAMKRSTCSFCGDICLFGSCSLPCLRTVCDKCYSYGKEAQDYACGFCNTTHEYDTLYRETDMRSILRTSLDISFLQTNRVSCTLCSSKDAISFCVTCQTYECVKCNRLHGVLFKHHVVQTVAERKLDIPSVLEGMKHRVVKETKFCPVHLHRKMKSYCSTCEKSFCRACSDEHHGHETMTLHAHALSLREETFKYLREKKQRLKIAFTSTTALHDSLKRRVEARYNHNISVLDGFMRDTRVKGNRISNVSLGWYSDLYSYATRERDHMLDRLRDYKLAQYTLSNEFSVVFDLASCPFTPFSSSFASSLRFCIDSLEKRIMSPKIHMRYFTVDEGVCDNGTRFRRVNDKTESLI